MSLITGLLDALSLAFVAFGMFWEILWALMLGFALCRRARLLPDDSARSLCLASGLGAASSSCSYSRLHRY